MMRGGTNKHTDRQITGQDVIDGSINLQHLDRARQQEASQHTRKKDKGHLISLYFMQSTGSQTNSHNQGRNVSVILELSAEMLLRTTENRLKES